MFLLKHFQSCTPFLFFFMDNFITVSEQKPFTAARFIRMLYVSDWCMSETREREDIQLAFLIFEIRSHTLIASFSQIPPSLLRSISLPHCRGNLSRFLLSFQDGWTLLHRSATSTPAHIYVMANNAVPINVQNSVRLYKLLAYTHTVFFYSRRWITVRCRHFSRI